MKHGGCNNKEALRVAFFHLEKARFFVELRFSQLVGAVAKSDFRRRGWPRGTTARGKVGHWARNCPQSDGLRKRFEHARTTPLTQAMLVTSCERGCKTLKEVFVRNVDNVVREAALVSGVQ